MQNNIICKKVFFLFLICSFAQSSIQAQAYNTAFGFRIGSDFGISFAQRFPAKSKTTAELIYEDGLFDSNRNGQLLIKQHLPLLSKRFNVFAGTGIGYIWHKDKNNTIVQESPIIPLTLGAEITFSRFNLSADFQPIFLFNKFNDNRVIRSSGVSLRYVLVKRKKKQLKDTLNSIFKRKKKNDKSKNS